MWDRKGQFKHLLGRDPDLAACAIDGVPDATIVLLLSLFCDAFDIPQSQRFCLRLEDRVEDIYAVMIMGPKDDLERERLLLNLQEQINRPVTEAEQAKLQTIKDLIRFLHANTPG